jgi:hypothetical protein
VTSDSFVIRTFFFSVDFREATPAAVFPNPPVRRGGAAGVGVGVGFGAAASVRRAARKTTRRRRSRRGVIMEPRR